MQRRPATPTGFPRPDILRPPSEWNSYYLPLTSGCSNNSCTFCSFHGRKLQLRDVGEVKAEVDALALYLGHGVTAAGQPGIVYHLADRWDGKKLFLQDGDALVYPFGRLTEVLEHLNGRIPSLERIASYGTPQDILRRSLAELRQLRKLKLGILYMGVESGDDKVLLDIGKGVTHDEMVEAGRKVKEAGIALSVTVILGLAGVEASQRHAHQTARILSQIDPDYAGALTLILVPGTPMHQGVEQGLLRTLSPMESLQELRTIVAASEFTNCFFSSMHASNYLSIRGRMPEDKTRLLKDLDEVILSGDPGLLRPEVLRGL